MISKEHKAWFAQEYNLKFLMTYSGIKAFLTISVLALLSCTNQATPPQVNHVSNHDLTITKAELTKIYVQSISDYIKAVNRDYALQFDTLFFGKHVYGQPDDFPDIELPKTIENTPIRLVTPELGTQKQRMDKASFLVNLIGWVNTETAEFIFVTFSNNNEHQFDYYLNYNYNTQSSAFVLDKIRFDNFAYPKK
jgi:hypothetical protein